MESSDQPSRPLEGHIRVDVDFGGLAFNLQQGIFIPDSDEPDLMDPSTPFIIEGDW